MNFLHVIGAVLGTGFIIFALHVLAAIIGVAVIVKYLPFFEKILARFRSRTNYTVRERYFSPLEKKLFEALSVAVEDVYVVLPHVRLSQMLESERQSKKWGSRTSYLDKKFVDFALFSKSEMAPVLVILYRNKDTIDMHQAYKNREVEEILNRASMAYLIVSGMEDITTLLAERLGT